jgi:hypothetical protein
MVDITGLDNRVTIRLPPDLLKKLAEEVEERNIPWKNRGDIIISSLSDHYLRKEPERIKEKIRQAIQEDPTILKDVIADQVREQVQIQLRQILGQK